MSAPASAGWGWHRLSTEWVRRLVASAEVSPGDLVLDIGAGDGAITARLLDAGARVVAVELHHDRAAALRARFGTDPVRVVCADAADLRLPRQPFRVVANLPFAVTAAVLRRLLHPASQLVRAELVVPRYAAARWADGRGEHRPSALATFELRHGGRVPRAAFRPPPPSDAARLVVVRRTAARPR